MIRTLVTWLLAILTGTAAIASPMNDGHKLTALWKQYEEASKADRPREEADLLARIKEEAIQKHLPVDFYDAATAYVRVVARRDWKQQDRLQEQLEKEVTDFDEPIVTFHWMNSWKGVSSEALWDYVKQNEDRFQGHTPAFYRNIQNYLGDRLKPFIRTDKEYVLWRILANRGSGNLSDDPVYKALLAEVSGIYPNEAALEYHAIGSRHYPETRWDEQRRALSDFAIKYSGKAVSVYPKADLLNLRKRELDIDSKSTADMYRSLCENARRLEAERKAYRGTEADIAAGCKYPEELVRTLNAKDLYVYTEKDRIIVLLRNLDRATVTLRSGQKSLKTWKAVNPIGSFYVKDTLTLQMPDLEDGDYTVEAVNGKLSSMDAYTQYTLSIATRKDAQGHKVYVADHDSGEPLRKVTLHLLNGDKLLASTSLKMDGFTPLPQAFVKAMEKEKDAYLTLKAVSGDRKSRPVGLSDRFSYSEGDRTRCHIYRDQGAYHPGDTVRFKAVVFRGDPRQSFSVVEGMEVEACLKDSEGKRLQALTLTTNEFGSVSGRFVLPRGARNGRFSLSISGLETVYFRVDEFVLPSFELSFDPVEQLYLAGDDVPVSGKLSSFSGHSLAGSRIALKISLFGDTILEEEGVVSADNGFRFTFPTKTNDSGYYHAEVKVTDASGETLSFTNGYFVGKSLSVEAIVTDDAVADLVPNANKYYHYATTESARYTLLGTSLRLKLEARDGAGNAVPGIVKYSLMKADESVLAEGETPSGKDLAFELPGGGFYRMKAEVEATLKDGQTTKRTRYFHFYCIPAGDSTLMPQLSRVFIPGPLTLASGQPVSARIGTSEGKAYALLLLYGENRQVLESRKLEVADGTIEDIRFDYKDSYPDAVRLQVFYFIHDKAVNYDWQFRREKDRFSLPLQFTRFHDKAYPGAQYSFTLRSVPAAEVLVAAWDKSLDAIQNNSWPLVHTRDVSVDHLFVESVCGRVGRVYVEHRMYRTKSLGGVMEDVVEEESLPFSSYEIASARMASASPAPLAKDANSVMDLAPEEGGSALLRSDFSTALTFQPQLRPSADGTLEFSFRTSDKLSTYYVRALAHDKEMHNALVEKEMVVSVPVKVALSEPRFMYAGDVYDCVLTVSSNSEKPVSGTLVLVTSAEGEPAASQMVPVTVNPGEVISRSFRINCPSCHSERSEESLTLKAVFKAAEFSDAVQVSVPLYPAAQVLTEAHSAVLRSGMSREALLKELQGRFVNVPSSAATLKEITVLDMVCDAIPSHVEPSGKDVLSLSEAWYIRLMAKRLDILGREREASGMAALDQESLLHKILACRNGDGGFGWFEGMKSSPSITAVMLERAAKLRSRGLVDLDLSSSVRYLDREQFNESRPSWYGALSDAQYCYIRSLYPQVPFEVNPVSEEGKKRMKAFKKWAVDYLTPSRKDGRGLKGQILQKSRRLMTLENLLLLDAGLPLAKAWGVKLSSALRKSMDADELSLLEYAVEHRDGGWYYPNAVMPWRGLMESEAYAHSLLCDLLTRVAPADSPVPDGIRLWLMLQKETQHWDTEPAYVDAITSILDGSEAVLNTRVLALSATYEAPFRKVKASGNGFKLERKFYREAEGALVEIKPGDSVQLGDRIRVKYLIWNAENRSFVKLTAGREASLQPVQQLSGHLGYGFVGFGRRSASWGFVPQGYRNVKASCTEFYFDSYPEENTELSEEFYVQRAGTFVAPVTVIESLYAPHYRANTAYRVPLVSVVR